MVLSRDGIAALIPHGGSMCMLHEVLSFDDDGIVCRAVNHRDSAHPLRDGGVLPAICGIEYAAQAMAVHGALVNRAASGVADSAAGNAGGRRGVLAAARNVTLNVERLDDIADDLIVSACKLVGQNGRLLYEFTLHAGGRELARGRAAVVLDAGTAA
jgi:predicted hotdog family 3-hydroxylacyl-ACP dehydratase